MVVRHAVPVPKEVAVLAQKSVDQAQAAAERVGEFAHDNLQVFDAATSALKARTADFQLKVMEMAQGNLDASFDFARRALAVSDTLPILCASAGIPDPAYRAIIPPIQGVGRIVDAFRPGNRKAFPGWLDEVLRKSNSPIFGLIHLRLAGVAISLRASGKAGFLQL